MAPVFRYQEESRRVKMLRSSCFIQGAGLYCLSCTDANGEKRGGSLSCPSVLTDCSQHHWTGAQRKQNRKGGDSLHFSLSKAKADTQLFMSFWGVFWDFGCEPTYCSLFKGGDWLANSCHSANNLGVKVRRKPCMRELPLSTFPKEWWNCLHGVSTFVSAYHHAMEYEDMSGVAHIWNCALLAPPLALTSSWVNAPQQVCRRSICHTDEIVDQYQ